MASLTAFIVALLCLLAWAFRLSVLVKLISDSILVGFKAGAGLHRIAAGAGVPPARGVPGPRARHQQLFRYRTTPGK
jgi:MFS superfamily sulfate permease-like transporter